MAVHGTSLDFDGCIFNQAYMGGGTGTYRDVIRSNKVFLDRLKKENDLFTKNYTFVGSSRQSYSFDLGCATHNSNGSCFPAIKIISDYLHTTLDPILLADIFGNLKFGTSYERAMDSTYIGEHAEPMFDPSKVILIYAQIHRLANIHPDEEIIFDFYDDYGPILDSLKAFYERAPHLMPANVTFRLHRYVDGVCTPQGEIKGTGFIDEHFTETVKDMINISESSKIKAYNAGTWYGPPTSRGEANVAKWVNLDLLQTRKALHKHSDLAHSSESITKVDETKSADFMDESYKKILGNLAHITVTKRSGGVDEVVHVADDTSSVLMQNEKTLSEVDATNCESVLSQKLF